MIFYGAILTIDTTSGGNNISFYPVGVEAETVSEAEGKLFHAARRNFPPSVRIEVGVNTGVDPVIRDPEKAGIETRVR